MNPSLTRIACSCFTLACAAPAMAQSDPWDAVPVRLEQFVADGEIAGAVTFVYVIGDTFVGEHLTSVGKANRETGVPMDDDTLFGIMSMTKPITATALMILVEEGKLSLDDPVEKHIPAFADAKTEDGEPVRGLTVRHVLTHTSGLTGDQGCEESLEATAAALAQRPFEFQPGEKWAYGPSINVVGRIVEVVAGEPYEQFLAERIFKPLGMNETTFHLSDAQGGRVAELYERTEAGELKGAERWGDAGSADAVPNPSGGLFSTAGDLARFYQLILRGGELDDVRILSADAIREMTIVQTGDLVTGFTPGNGWGLGWCVVREPQGVSDALSPGSFGHGGAYGTQAWIDPERKAFYVLLIQRSNLPNSDASDIRAEFQRAAVEAMTAESVQ
jgi:CubicO group peptidase (beta-lactamase class C family)